MCKLPALPMVASLTQDKGFNWETWSMSYVITDSVQNRFLSFRPSHSMDNSRRLSVLC